MSMHGHSVLLIIMYMCVCMYVFVYIYMCVYVYVHHFSSNSLLVNTDVNGQERKSSMVVLQGVILQ